MPFAAETFRAHRSVSDAMAWGLPFATTTGNPAFDCVYGIRFTSALLSEVMFCDETLISHVCDWSVDMSSSKFCCWITGWRLIRLAISVANAGL